MDKNDAELWERLEQLWPLVVAEIEERVRSAKAMLESSSTTQDIERVREIQGEIKGLKSAANIVPQKLVWLKQRTGKR